MAPLLDGLEGALSRFIDLPYVLFGYSMGALLAYELALRLAGRDLVPRCLILAARPPPWRMIPRPSRAILERDELIARIRRLGGTAPALIDSEIFDDHFLPVLKADFTLADTFSREIPQILPCPILCLAARDDPDVAVDQMRAWRTAAGRGFKLELFGGGHFFLHNAHDEVIAFVNNVLSHELEGSYE
jgi:surfactin synthase thioesterase subunit